MSALNNTTASTQSTGTQRIVLASAFRRERHSSGRQERAGRTLRKMSGFEDQAAKNCDRRLIEAADDLLDE